MCFAYMLKNIFELLASCCVLDMKDVYFLQSARCQTKITAVIFLVQIHSKYQNPFFWQLKLKLREMHLQLMITIFNILFIFCFTLLIMSPFFGAIQWFKNKKVVRNGQKAILNICLQVETAFKQQEPRSKHWPYRTPHKQRHHAELTGSLFPLWMPDCVDTRQLCVPTALSRDKC